MRPGPAVHRGHEERVHQGPQGAQGPQSPVGHRDCPDGRRLGGAARGAHAARAHRVQARAQSRRPHTRLPAPHDRAARRIPRTLLPLCLLILTAYSHSRVH